MKSNQGIIGNVKANVVAVGSGASAVQNVGSIDARGLKDAIVELHAAIHALNLAPTAREAVAGDLDGLKKEASQRKPKADHIAGFLKSLAGKLKMIGVVMTETTSLVEPVGKIAAALRLTLSGLGLG